MDVRLEPLSEAYAADLEELVRDESVLRFTRVPVPVPPGFTAGWAGRYEEARRAGTAEGFAIVDDAGAFLGLALAPRIDDETRTAELGYVVAPAARGRGVATSALRALTAWAFERGLVRLELLIATDNDASQRVAERCGYVREGVLRSLYFKQGRRADTEIWSRLPDDP